MEPGDLFTADITFKCPFCGLSCSANKNEGVVHAMPPCKKFIELDAEDFVHEYYIRRVPQA